MRRILRTRFSLIVEPKPNGGQLVLLFHFVFIKLLGTPLCHHFVSKRIAAILSENGMKLLRDNTKQRRSLDCIS